MQGIANRLEAQSAIRSDLGAIFVSMELSRSYSPAAVLFRDFGSR